MPDQGFQGVHLNGSVALESSQEVFRWAGANFPAWVKRIPDGEVGRRWVASESPVFYDNESFDVIRREDAPTAEGTPAILDQVRPKPGVDAASIRFDETVHAAGWRESYAVFSRLKAEGVLRPDARLLIARPTPMQVVVAAVTWDAVLDVLPAWERRVQTELARFFDEIPHSELAFQWDLPFYVYIYEEAFPNPFGSKQRAVEGLAQACTWIPADVELGFHLCFGDSKGGRAFEDPARPGEMVEIHRENVRSPEKMSCAALVELANALATNVRHSIAYMHLPTLTEWTEPEDWQPLAGLALDPSTELYIGVVHDEDGIDGATKRVRAVIRAIGNNFGVSTECGLGRFRPDEFAVATDTLRTLATHLDSSPT
jgi:hypothetical protein